MTLPPSNVFSALARLIEAGGSQARPAYKDRQAIYDLEASYYHNQAYEAHTLGGYRQTINAGLGNTAAADLAGLYNPVASVVDLYQHVLGGSFRRVDDDEGEDQPTDIRAESDNPALLEALDQLWQTSNLDVTKQTLCRLPALHGTCGIRIRAVDDPDPARRRVYLKAEHPRIIRDVELNERGDVQAIDLEYDVTRGLGDDQQVVTIREELRKDYLATYRVIASGALIPHNLATGQDDPTAVYPNPLGVVPYVLLTHQDGGEAFGLNAWYRARSAIDRLNALLTHIDVQIHDHVNVVWVIAGSGTAPTSIDLTGRKVLYVDTSRGGSVSADPLVAPLSLADALARARHQIELIEDALPELKAAAGRFLSGQSGDTVATLRAPAEHRLGLARARYEDALTRASQIAVSWGVLLGAWDVGTGSGSPEAAERAYREGFEAFSFNRRPLFPPTEPKAQPQPAALATPAQVVTPPPAEEAPDAAE